MVEAAGLVRLLVRGLFLGARKVVDEQDQLFPSGHPPAPGRCDMRGHGAIQRLSFVARDRLPVLGVRVGDPHAGGPRAPLEPRPRQQPDRELIGPVGHPGAGARAPLRNGGFDRPQIPPGQPELGRVVLPHQQAVQIPPGRLVDEGEEHGQVPGPPRQHVGHHRLRHRGPRRRSLRP